MTREQLDTIKDWLSTLSGDELAGALDALSAIEAARMPSGGGYMTPPSEIEIDPDLEEPEYKDSPAVEDDLEIDDPDEVLKKKKSDKETESTEESSEDGDLEPKTSSDADTEDAATEDEDSDLDTEDGDDTEEASDDLEDMSDSGDEDEADEDEADEEEAEDFVDDEDGSLPDSLKKDPSEESAKKAEIFRRKVELASAKKQLKRARKKIESGDVDASSDEKSTLDAFDTEVADRIKELDENPESITEESASAFNDFIKSILDFTDDLGVHHTEIADMDSRLKRLSDATGDSFALDDLEAEDMANKLKDPEFQKMKAREREKERLRKELESGSAFNGDIESFKRDLKKAIGNQISTMIEVEEETYARVNRWHETDDIAVPGIRIEDIPDYKKPSIDVYIDQSGSWSEADVKKGKAAVAEILKLEDEDLLNVEIYYFSALLSQDAATARSDGRYECWDLVIENINAAPKTKNVIIMTDTDIEHDWRVPGCHGCVNGPGTVVDGCVWFLWKNGKRVSTASKKLRGKMGTFEYSV